MTVNFINESMAKPKGNIEEGVLGGLFQTEVPITKETVSSNLYRVFIDDVIGGSTTYRSLIALLNSAQEEDTFVFHLSSPGGEAEVALQIYLAMLTTKAHTIAQIDSYAASAATFFVMAAKQVAVGPNAYMMIHGAKFGEWGHMQEMKRVVNFQYDRLMKILQDVYEGFFTQEEITNMVEQQIDTYLTADEILERLFKRQEYEQLKAEMETQELFETVEAIVEEEPKKKPKRTVKKKEK